MSIIQNEYIEEAEFVREHNRVYGKILYNERKRRKIAQADLAYGILSRSPVDEDDRRRSHGEDGDTAGSF